MAYSCLLSLALRSTFIILCLHEVVGDVYMHNPRGSNNRLNSNGQNRQNANRLFDSQVKSSIKSLHSKSVKSKQMKEVFRLNRFLDKLVFSCARNKHIFLVRVIMNMFCFFLKKEFNCTPLELLLRPFERAKSNAQPCKNFSKVNSLRQLHLASRKL